MQEPTSSRTAQRRRRSPAAARRGAAPRRGLGGAFGRNWGGRWGKTSGKPRGRNWGGSWGKTSGKPRENREKTMNIIWKQIGNNMEHLISQSHVETMHEKLDGRKTKTIEHPGTTLKQLGIFRIQPSIS